MPNSFFSHLECSECLAVFSKSEIQTFCSSCNAPLSAKYTIPLKGLSKSVLKNREKNMWRYHEMLPIENSEHIISLGEGFSPLLKVNNIALSLSLSNLYIKDESMNPTGSFKARGLSMAISKAKEFGISKVAIPTAGNAGSAMSAYAAKAKIESYVFMPIVTPSVFKMDCKFFGAHVTFVNGSIRDCGIEMNRQNLQKQWFDISTLKEPYRLEGKKTMGYEIAEQMNWQLPDVIIYPAGGGTGLIGIWKAFQEMLALGWITSIPTRMVCVQAEGCSPIVDAFNLGLDFGKPIENPEETIANGLRVPSPFGHKWMLRVIKQSKGTAVKVSDDEMQQGVQEIAQSEGLFVAPEGAATWMALKKLLNQGWLKPTEKIVLLNTGSAYKYLENLLR